MKVGAWKGATWQLDLEKSPTCEKFCGGCTTYMKLSSHCLMGDKESLLSLMVMASPCAPSQAADREDDDDGAGRIAIIGGVAVVVGH